MRILNFIKKTYFKSYKTIKNDDFIKRLKCTVIGEGMLHDGNIYSIDYALKNIPKKGIILEIGSYGGLSTNLILYLLKKYNMNHKMYGCDAWIYEGYNDNDSIIKNTIDGRSDINRIDYMNHIKNSFIESTKLLSNENLPYTCHLKSDDFFKKWNNNETFHDVFNRDFKINDKIAFAYVDGNHSYEQTKKDFENVSKKLMLNGFVLIDDTAENLDFGSVLFAKEILNNSEFKLVFKNPNYLFQKIH